MLNLKCSGPPPESLISDTLEEMIGGMAYKNTRKLNELEYVVKEKGNREADVKMLRKLKDILFYPQDNSFLLPAEADSVDLIKLGDYTRHLISEAEQNNWEGRQEIPETIERLRKSEVVFRESRSQLDYDILTINLFLLKKAFINQISMEVGMMDIIDYGLVQMTCASDTLKINEKFTALLTPWEQIDGNTFEIGKGWLLLTHDGRETGDYDLEYVGGGGWIFSFVPGLSGDYQLKFGFRIHSKLDRHYPGYPFYTERKLYVE
jgi:hypothetical protein